MTDARSRFENHGTNQRRLGEGPAAAIDAAREDATVGAVTA